MLKIYVFFFMLNIVPNCPLKNTESVYIPSKVYGNILFLHLHQNQILQTGPPGKSAGISIVLICIFLWVEHIPSIHWAYVFICNRIIPSWLAKIPVSGQGPLKLLTGNTAFLIRMDTAHNKITCFIFKRNAKWNCTISAITELEKQNCSNLFWKSVVIHKQEEESWVYWIDQSQKKKQQGLKILHD
jgi:hypothetical protein